MAVAPSEPLVVVSGGRAAESLHTVQAGLSLALALAAKAIDYGDLSTAARDILGALSDLGPELEALRMMLGA